MRKQTTIKPGKTAAHIKPKVKVNDKPLNKPVALTNEGGDVRELLQADFDQMVLVAAALPHLALLHKKTRGRPPAAVKSVPKSIRLAADVAAHFEAMGRGWQTRMNEVLRELILTQKL